MWFRCDRQGVQKAKSQNLQHGSVPAPSQIITEGSKMPFSGWRNHIPKANTVKYIHQGFTVKCPRFSDEDSLGLIRGGPSDRRIIPDKTHRAWQCLLFHGTGVMFHAFLE